MERNHSMPQGRDHQPATRRMDSPVMAAVKAALGGGAMAFLFAAVIPVGWLETVAYQLYLDTIIPSARAPLGMTARIICAAALAALVAALVFAGHRWLAASGLGQMIGHRMARRSAAASAVPNLRRADAHPDAPARAPIHAEQDLDLPGLMSGLSVAELRDAKPAGGGLAPPPPRRADMPVWAYHDEAMAQERPPEVDDTPLDLSAATALLAARNAAVEREQAEREQAERERAERAAREVAAPMSAHPSSDVPSVNGSDGEDMAAHAHAPIDEAPLELTVLDAYTDALDGPETSAAPVPPPQSDAPDAAFAARADAAEPAVSHDPDAANVVQGPLTLADMVARLEAGMASRRGHRLAAAGTAARPMERGDGAGLSADDAEEPTVDFALEAALSTLNRMARRAVG